MTKTLSLSCDGWQCAGAQILGDRAEQQDDFAGAEIELEGQTGLILALADGMGGHAGGALAAQLAVEGAVAGFRAAEGRVHMRLHAGLARANQAIAEARHEGTSALRDMGCTLLLVALAPGRAWYLSVGDSLLLQAEAWRLKRLNEDHSMAPLVDALVREGSLTREQAAHDPRRHQLRSALTGAPVALVDAPEEPIELPREGCLVLASDGLVAAPHERVSSVLGTPAPPEKQAEGLLQAARAGQVEHLDNTSLIVCAHAPSAM
ncbi:MAG: protein phosphatase 2C domain-containing protein [Hyphomonadaceae bacterium]|nr:protein phosphatase 2C domain-containing protein [Hyphomonadaceae bacterium]